MNNDLRQRAKRLAGQPYTVVIAHDKTTDGDSIYVAYNPELLGCMAQGETIQEAVDDLSLVREEYILSLLEDGISIPTPTVYASETTVQNAYTSYSTQVSSNVSMKSEPKEREVSSYLSEYVGAETTLGTALPPDQDKSLRIAEITVIET